MFTGKARRLKQAKEEAQDEIEKYRLERERQFKEFEAKVRISLLLLLKRDKYLHMCFYYSIWVLVRT